MPDKKLLRRGARIPVWGVWLPTPGCACWNCYEMRFARAVRERRKRLH